MTEEKKITRWLVMVYINADDVLANFATDSLNQLRRAAAKIEGSDITVKALFNPTGRKGQTRFFSWDSPVPPSPAPNAALDPEAARAHSAELADRAKRAALRLSTPLKKIALEEEGPFGGSEVDMTEVDILTKFVDDACGDPAEWKDRGHCLIFWGHGTELLLDQDPEQDPEQKPNQEPGGKSRYLTPAKLRKALMNTKLIPETENTKTKNQCTKSEFYPGQSKKLDIVAFDACNMSMIELASELQECADFMIASQEDVQDVSFPYEELLPLLNMDVKKTCEEVPGVYTKSFQDYLITPGNGMQRTTLSSLQLNKVSKITDPLKALVGALRTSISDPEIVDAIIAARKGSRDFVLGIFVDLRDFCEKLKEELKKQPEDQQKQALAQTYNTLVVVCDVLSTAINKKECVIANKVGLNEKPEKHKKREKQGKPHGISIYFPYSVQDTEMELWERLLGTDQTGGVVSVPFVKGTKLNPSKGTKLNPSKGTKLNPSKSAVIEVRIQRIQELEADFAELTDKNFLETGWLDFITKVWPVILAQEPEALDWHYSAQQFAKNFPSILRDDQAKTLALKGPRPKK